jgi:toxin ParE1/3/4
VTVRVVWRAAAEWDVESIVLRLGGSSAVTADRFVIAVVNAAALLAANPLAGSPRKFDSPRARGVRSWVLRGFPNYVVFYRLRGDRLEIIRVLHGARDLPRLIEGED